MEGDDGEGGDGGEEGVEKRVGRGESEGAVIDFMIGGHPTDFDDLGDRILGELGGVENTLHEVLDSVDEFGVSAEDIADGAAYLEEMGLMN